MAKRDVWELTREMFLSEAEVESIRDSLRQRLAASGPAAVWQARTDQLIFEVLTFSGLRNSEFCHLRVNDVPPAFKQPALRVAETPRQDRVVAIPQSLVDLIRDYVQEVRPHLLHDSMPVKDLTQPLVVNERGRPLDRTTLYRRVVKILSEAGFESRASVQLLRHTYGYLAYKRTRGNLLFVQQQLGHSHPMVTAVYAEFVEFSTADLANLVGEDSVIPTSSFPKSAASGHPARRQKGKL
jgi:integrase/recombinase XerD